MASVTGRIKEIAKFHSIGKEYVSISDFDRWKLRDSRPLNQNENIHGSIIGSAVEYLTRFYFLKN